MRYVSLEWQAGGFALLTGILLTIAIVMGLSADGQASFMDKEHQHPHSSSLSASVTAAPAVGESYYPLKNQRKKAH